MQMVVGQTQGPRLELCGGGGLTGDDEGIDTGRWPHFYRKIDEDGNLWQL